MKIILMILGFVFISFWLAVIIGIGVSAGIKIAYKELSKDGGK